MPSWWSRTMRQSRARNTRWAPGALVLVIIGLLAFSPNRSAPAPSWQSPVHVARGEAHRGPWRMNESDYRWVDDATLDVTNAGEIAVAWVDQARHDVFLQRFGSDGQPLLDVPSNVSRTSATFSWLPRVLFDPKDSSRIYVSWQEIVFSGGSHGGEISFAASSDAGRSFGEPHNLSSSKAGDGKGRLDRDTWDNGSLDLAIGPKGQLYVAWTEYEGALWFRRSTDGGQTFSKLERIGGTGEAPARGPSIAVARDGTIHVAWAVGESATADIQLASSSDGGVSFAVPRSVCESPGHSDAPKLAATSDGALHLAYAESNESGGKTYHVRYGQQRRGEARFEPCAPVAGSRGELAASAHYPQLSSDTGGRLYLLWEGYRAGQERPQLLVLTYSAEDSRRFATPSIVPAISRPALGFNGSQQGALTRKLAVSDAGLIAIVNSTFRPNDDSHVWLLRGELENGRMRRR